MKRLRLSIFVAAMTVLGAAVSALLRWYQLSFCMDAAGLLAKDSRIGYGMLFFVIFGVVSLGLLCFKLNKLPGTEACFSKSVGFTAANLVSGLLLLAGCLMQTSGSTDKAARIIYLFGCVTALLLLATPALRQRNRNLAFTARILPCIFLAAKLILDFKHWSYDPIVIDFCFKLLFSVCSMLAVFHLAGFPLQYGKRRMTVFWCAGAVVFSVMNLPDFFLGAGFRLADLLIYCGFGLWCGSHGLQLLRPCVQDETLPPVPETPQE